MSRKKTGVLVLICLLFIVISLSNCSKGPAPSLQEKRAKQLTLKVMTFGSSSKEACERISKALSQITMEQYGFKVELKQAGWLDYYRILRREQMLGKGPDMFLYSDRSQLTGFVASKEVLGLNELLTKEGSSLLEQIGEDAWSSVTLNNTIYALPAQNGSSYSQGFIARKDIVDALNINPADITDLDSLHALLLRVKNEYQDMVPVVSHFGRTIDTLGQDPLGDDLGVLLNGDNTKVEDLFSSDRYYAVSKRIRQWYKEGLILENAHSYNESYSTLLNAFNGFGYFIRVNEYAAAAASRSIGNEMVAFRLSDPILNSSNYNLGWCISSATPYARQAMQLLNLLYNNEEVADLCIYGQEGIDYTRLDRKTVSSPYKKSNVAMWNTIAWSWPNRDIASDWKQDNYVGLKAESPKNIKVSLALGFVFDSSAVQDKVDKCNSVVDKYDKAILSGYLDPDEVIPRFVNELKEAGLDTIIVEKQSQLNSWLEKKSK